jgi:membrane-associated phospholipid phosphatase
VNVAHAIPWHLVRLRACALTCIAVSSLVLHAQDNPPISPAGTPAKQFDSSSESSSASSHTRDVSLNLLPRNFLRDQQNIWFFPSQLAQGRYWSPTVTVVSASVALLSADAYAAPYFNHTKVFSDFNRAFGSNVTGAETIAMPAALYAIGLDRRDSYMQKTALFAGEAVADSEVLRAVLNTVTARWRPQDIYKQRNYADTFFRSASDVGSSFPSGHMIAAISVATVIARRYRNNHWVPWVAYGLAGTIGFSRISLRAHFPSDVFLGAVLGYAIARYDVLQNQ